MKSVHVAVVTGMSVSAALATVLQESLATQPHLNAANWVSFAAAILTTVTMFVSEHTGGSSGEEDQEGQGVRSAPAKKDTGGVGTQ